MKSKVFLFILAGLLGSFTAVGLFLLMNYMISEPGDISQNKNESIAIQFLSNFKESDVQNREREKPEKPRMPDLQTPNVSVSPSPSTELKVITPITLSAPNIKGLFGSGAGLVTGGRGIASAGSGLVSLVRRQPDTPQRAKMLGIKGRVTISYDINSEGRTENVLVLSSKPARIFDQNSINAVLDWRYKPPTNSKGEPQPVYGNQYTFSFDLEE